MDDLQNISARRSSPHLDPLSRLVSELSSSSSAPCSPRLGSRPLLHQESQETSSGPSSLTEDYSRSTCPSSPLLLPRKKRPVPPPRPKLNRTGPPLILGFNKDSSLYANVSNLALQKNRWTSRDIGYEKLKETSYPTNGSSRLPESFDHSTNAGSSSGGWSPFENNTKNHFDFDVAPLLPPSLDSILDGKYFKDSVQNYPSTTSTNSGHNQYQELSITEPILSGYSTTASQTRDKNYLNTLDELDWQERCLQLQMQLYRSKNQTTRVRETLREKVRENTVGE